MAPPAAGERGASWPRQGTWNARRQARLLPPRRRCRLAMGHRRDRRCRRTSLLDGYGRVRIDNVRRRVETDWTCCLASGRSCPAPFGPRLAVVVDAVSTTTSPTTFASSHCRSRRGNPTCWRRPKNCADARSIRPGRCGSCPACRTSDRPLPANASRHRRRRRGRGRLRHTPRPRRRCRHARGTPLDTRTYANDAASCATICSGACRDSVRTVSSLVHPVNTLTARASGGMADLA